MVETAGLRALEEGRAFVHLSGWRVTAATGADALTWLNDLLTRRLDDIGPDQLRRSLFLDRTGRTRADVYVRVTGDGVGAATGALLFQDPTQPLAIGDLLAPYVLSADVALEDWSGRLALIAVHSGISSVQFMEWPGTRDRMGQFLVTPEDLEAKLDALRGSNGLTEATLQDTEDWRIRRGIPRFGVDFGEDWLPSEAGMDDLVDATKGCFLGQESVARIRNLGHPPRLVVALQSPQRIYPMAEILANGERVGRITSVATLDDGETACIGWVRWGAREAELATDGRVRLRARSDHTA
jgi:folate-binding protein YgfZ